MGIGEGFNFRKTVATMKEAFYSNSRLEAQTHIINSAYNFMQCPHFLITLKKNLS
jgi:hypothetical protein